AKAFIGQAACEGVAGDTKTATELLERARRLFDDLGTVDGPPLASAVLDVLGLRDTAPGEPPLQVLVSSDRPQLFRVLARQFFSNARVIVATDTLAAPDARERGYVVVRSAQAGRPAA